jgi:hypothetical protein
MIEQQRREGALSTSDIARPEEQRVEIVEGPQGTALKKEDAPGPLFAPAEGQDLRSQWEKIQTGFVDEPRQAVKDADGLVAVAIKRLAEIFADERSKMEREWDRGDNVSTEDLRIALRRYRSFFDRILSV